MATGKGGRRLVGLPRGGASYSLGGHITITIAIAINITITISIAIAIAITIITLALTLTIAIVDRHPFFDR